MPPLEDETPRLAEVARALQDFRHEFRESMRGVVRRDVYDANQQTLQLQINNLQAAVMNNENELEKERKERQTTRNLIVTLAVPTAVSLFIAIVGWVTGTH